nr:hypothetical protein [Candidatus Sigynarchaeota archaeon]
MVPDIPKDVIFTASGTRGIVGEPTGLTPAFLVPLAMAYSTWLRQSRGGKVPSLIIGRDTRPSGYMIEAGMIHAVLATGCDLHVAGICPTPAIVHAKQRMGLDGAIIISASHNPAEYNGIKFLSPQQPGTFLSNEELDEITTIFHDSRFHLASWKQPGMVTQADVITPYLKAIANFVKPFLKSKPHFKVAIDSGAGAAKYATIPLLQNLGCEIKSINENMTDTPPFFPRDSEPVEQNLGLLSKTVKENTMDLGMGIDCDADRISLCDEKGHILREDEGLALIMRNMLDLYQGQRKLVIVTNVASSLMFDDIAREKGGDIIRTPIGERYLAVKMHELAQKEKGKNRPAIIGGEGSCGGVMMPELNLARDASLAAACIIAILEKRGVPLSALAKELPEYHLEKVKLGVTGHNPLKVMEQLASLHDPSSFTRVMNDIKFAGDGWWVLIHPSNTEPVIRILAEARSADRAASLLTKYQGELLSLLSSP